MATIELLKPSIFPDKIDRNFSPGSCASQYSPEQREAIFNRLDIINDFLKQWESELDERGDRNDKAN